MLKLLFLGNIGATELIVIVVLVLLLFGGKKIPELMHGIGKGVHSFKEGMEGKDSPKQTEEKETKESEK